MQMRPGTSGFSYREWRGGFYPTSLEPAAMLEYYSARLPAVEINNTFYRMPSADMMRGYRERTPAAFRFVLKAPRSITHSRRLRDCEELTHRLVQAASELGDKRGPLLFQLPPNFQRDLDRLDAFVAGLPAGVRAAFEFRHPSWLEASTYQRLERAGAALCIADTGGDDPELRATAEFTYLRLRRDDYDETALARWVKRLEALDVSEAYVFFKHERRAPELALAFAAHFD